MGKAYESLAHVYDNLIYEDIDYNKIGSLIIDSVNSLNISKDKYLDIACGTGTITTLISKFFSETWAVDYSADMLMEADIKLRDNNLRARLIQQDMVHLSLYETFNLITCVLDAVNYINEIDDLKCFLSRVYEHLDENGIFIFDINSSYKLKNILGNNTFIYNTDELFYSWENELDGDLLYMYLTFFIKEGNTYRRFEEQHMERAYSQELMEKLIKEAKLEILMKLDDYNANKEVQETTERIVYIIRKANKE